MTPEIAAAILNLPLSSTREEVEVAYRRRARMTHPDRFSGAPQQDLNDAAVEFTRIGEARGVL